MASQKMNAFIFWSVQRFFAVRFAHSMASFAGLPGSNGLRYSNSCGKLLAIEVPHHPPLPGPGARSAWKMIQWIIFSEGGLEGHGRGSPPWWGLGAWSARKGCQWQAFSGKRAGRPRKSPIVLPVKFLFV